MTGNAIDRRALRTRNRIGAAFLRLGGVGSIDRLRVGQLAREAGIARSTFYAHFAGIEDYLARSFADMLAGFAASGPPGLILSVTAILEHVAAAGPGATMIARHRHFPRMLIEGENALRRVAEARLAQRLPTLDPAERRALAIALAAAFLAMLRDWMEDPHGRDPAEIAVRLQRIETRLAGSADAG